MKAIFVMAFFVGAFFAGDASSLAEDLIVIEAVPVDLEEEVARGMDIPGHGDDAEHSSGGLPQLHFVWFPSQIFWLLVTFLLLFAVFSRKVLPDISGTIEHRRGHIQGDLDTADNLKSEAEEARETYESLLHDANLKAMEAMSKADDSLKKKTADTLDKFREKSLSTVQDTEKAIAKSKKAAMGEMHDVAAEVASLAANKIIGVPADIKKAKNIVTNLNKKAA
ncbi:hypothetical protein N9Z27_00425 [Alphaproteobacteria bacterium]|nr:hypothetical protein [Alphaproteobacteria bacterium]